MKQSTQLVFVIGLLTATVQAAEIKVAVAANFKSALETLSQRFSEKEKDHVVITSASSGVIYNQIMHGAPYDLFLSADSKRPEMLEDKQLILSGSRQPYAYGRLVLWDKSGKVNRLSDLKSWKGKLAIANPATAPYGLAAEQVLKKRGLWKTYSSRLIQGGNIQQTWLFVESGNASVGMVAWSQLVGKPDQNDVSFIPENDYAPIRQEMVILRSSNNEEAAKKFADFLMSSESQQYIGSHGHAAVTESRSKG